MSDPFWPLALAALGAILGSFLATVAIRWPAGRSALTGRSACDACDRALSAVDLIPLISFAANRGRARCCGAAIPALHWQVEAGCALAGLLAGLVASGGAALLIASFGWLLVLVIALDATELWIPDPLLIILAALGIIAAAVLTPAMGERIIGGIAGFGSLWLIGFIYQRLRGIEGLGGADPKLFGVIGLWLGWRMLPPVLLLAAMVGLGVVAWRMMTGRAVARDDALPFGAYLAVAAYPALLLMVRLSA
ncbi:A24 family peptidase [Sphingomonas sp.]|uniref:prepilin peptidase n=1 Tax=Sphingomonas sp. TaxID=28214 RepID=UPI002609BE2A|nr:A24 family peptidase [Sphingomonas sp.]MDF2495111.1 peptidase [Sphingomonas sp.]